MQRVLRIGDDVGEDVTADGSAGEHDESQRHDSPRTAREMQTRTIFLRRDGFRLMQRLGQAGAQQLGHGKGYVYPHDLPEGIVAQGYAPDAVAGRAYYEPTTHGMESLYSERYARIRAILRGPGDGGSAAGEGSAAAGSDAETGTGAGDDRPSEGGACERDRDSRADRGR